MISPPPGDLVRRIHLLSACLCAGLSIAPLQQAFPQSESATEGIVTNHGAHADLVTLSRHTLKSLSNHGISVSGMLVQDWSRGLTGSVDSGEGFGRYSFDLTASFDNAELLGLKGSNASVRLKHHIEEFGVNDYGMAQVISNIDASSRTSLYEMWLQQTLLNDRVRLKFGKIDANTEFAVVQNGGDFLNSSMGFSPTILAFPSYPEPQMGISTTVSASKGFGLETGVFRTAGNGALTLIEPRRKWTIGANELNGHLNVGYWRLDRTTAHFGGGASSCADGFYLVAEQDVWKRPLGTGGDRRVAAFLQVGSADPNISPFTSHLGLGAVFEAPFQKRRSDSIGIAATRVRFSSHPDAGYDYASEVVWEFYYRMAVVPHIAVVPDLQFVRHPGGMYSNPDCLVLTPRLVVSF